MTFFLIKLSVKKYGEHFPGTSKASPFLHMLRGHTFLPGVGTVLVLCVNRLT